MQKIILIDANARVGSIKSSRIGLCEVEKETTNGEALRLSLEDMRLNAVNTFFDAGWTWAGSRHHRSRIDYILADDELMQAVTDCAVCRDLELSEAEREDHFLVGANFEISSKKCEGT